MTIMKSNNIDLSLQRETLVDKIVKYLEKGILSGEIPPKTKFSEPKIASEFNVSRAPAREALQRLEEMNLIRRTRTGREVIAFSSSEFREIYELKNVIEAYGAMQGALNAKPRDVEMIQSCLKDMRAFTHLGKLKKLKYLNYQFHDLLVKCSNNRKLIDTFIILAKQIRWATSLSLGLPDRPKKSLAEHTAIFNAFKNRDAENVRILLETHSNQNLNRILSRIKYKEKKLI